MKRTPPQEILPAAVSEICGRYRISELGLFGSVARGEAQPNSDADVYVEFEAGYHPGLGWFDLEEELAGTRHRN